MERQTLLAAHASELSNLSARMKKSGSGITLEGQGNGPNDAYLSVLEEGDGKEIQVFSYSEHSVGIGSDATAFVEVEVDGKRVYGVGCDPNIVAASLIAVTCVVNRSLKGRA